MAWKRLGWILAAGATLSFLGAIIVASLDARYAKWAFFMLPTRAWEMLAGGLVAYYGARIRLGAVSGRLLEVGGLALIAVSIVVLNERLLWPSHWTAIPVAGTAAVILAARADAGWARLPPVRAVGTWSYSIYLWHWPIVVAAAYFGVERTAPVTIAMLFGSIAIGALSYRVTEVWLRKALFEQSTSLRRVAIPLGVLTLVLAFTGAGLSTHGWEAWSLDRQSPERRSDMEDYRAALADWRYPEVCRGEDRSGAGLALCRLGDNAEAVTLVIGDSHAQQLAPRYASLTGGAVVFATKGGCPPLPEVERAKPGYNCRDFTDAAFRLAASGQYRQVVLVAAWGLYFRPSAGVLCFGSEANCHVPRTPEEGRAAATEAFERLAARLADLKAAGIQPIILLEAPWAEGGDPRGLYEDAFFGRPRAADAFELADWRARTGAMAGQLARVALTAGAIVVDPADHLCDKSACPFRAGGHHLFKDHAHYRASAVSGPAFSFLDGYLLSPTAAP